MIYFHGGNSRNRRDGAIPYHDLNELGQRAQHERKRSEILVLRGEGEVIAAREIKDRTVVALVESMLAHMSRAREKILEKPRETRGEIFVEEQLHALVRIRSVPR